MFNTHPTRLIGLLALFVVAACTTPRDSAFLNRGGPESLLDVSSEVVTVNIADKKDIDALNRWVSEDQPTRAELQCDAMSPNCKDAIRVLEKKGVSIATNPSNANTATLVYERILARDCNQRYREPVSANIYNEPAPAFGCSLAANVVQHVSDKSVFVNPSISDDAYAVGAVGSVRRAYAPPAKQDTTYDVKTSTTSGAKTQ